MSFKNAMQATQKSVLQYAKQGRRYEVLSAILDARNFNTNIIESIVGFDANNMCQLKIDYYDPVADDVVVKPKKVDFSISRTTASAVYQLNRDDIRYIDGNYIFSDHAKASINAGLPAARRKLAVELSNLLVSKVGLFPNGADKIQLPFMEKSTGQVTPMGLWEIERIYRDSGLSDPFIVGGTDVFHWRKAIEIGTSRAHVYYDSLINDAFQDATTEHVLTFDTQMLKFVSFNRNANIFATDLQDIDAIDAVYQRGGADYIEGVMADPLTGLLWDLNVRYDDSIHRWTFQWKLEWDIFFVPVMDNNKVNSLFHFTLQTDNHEG